MKFTIKREYISKSLQKISGYLSNRPVTPILGNLLLKVQGNELILSTTNLEIEMISKLVLNDGVFEEGSITVSARKFLDICRCLPENSQLNISLKDKRVHICSNNSSYVISTLPVTDFPNLGFFQNKIKFSISQNILKKSIEYIKFSMANQDARYYLNGMLLEIKNNIFRTVTTDGYRLSLFNFYIGKLSFSTCSIIIPRKSILELTRILNNSMDIITINLGTNKISVDTENYIFRTKLISGIFPDYNSVLSNIFDKKIEVDCLLLKSSCIRASILSNYKTNSIKLFFSSNKLKIFSNNAEQEEAKEILKIIYQYENLEINLNVNYLLDILNVLKCEKILIFLKNNRSPIKIEDPKNKLVSYIIMPIIL